MTEYSQVDGLISRYKSVNFGENLYCITQLKAQGPSRTRDESREEEEEPALGVARARRGPDMLEAPGERFVVRSCALLVVNNGSNVTLGSTMAPTSRPGPSAPERLGFRGCFFEQQKTF